MTLLSEMAGETLWVCGCRTQLLADTWQIVGIYSSETLAVEQCKNPEYFVAPMRLDVDDDDNDEWEGLYFPLDTDNST